MKNSKFSHVCMSIWLIVFLDIMMNLAVRIGVFVKVVYTVGIIHYKADF